MLTLLLRDECLRDVVISIVIVTGPLSYYVSNCDFSEISNIQGPTINSYLNGVWSLKGMSILGVERYLTTRDKIEENVIKIF